MQEFEVDNDHAPDDRYLERHGPAVAWLGPGWRPCEYVPDRFRGEYLRLSPHDRNLHSDSALADSGVQALSLRDADRLGFKTIEYHACLRVEMLTSRPVQDEGELADEVWQADSLAEHLPDRLRTEAIGWASGGRQLSARTPVDRFSQKWLVRSVSGRIDFSDSYLSDVGIESLSLADAITLGFSTREYRAAFYFRLHEARPLQCEEDLRNSIEYLSASGSAVRL
jgi:hypothetical protein